MLLWKMKLSENIRMSLKYTFWSKKKVFYFLKSKCIQTMTKLRDYVPYDIESSTLAASKHKKEVKQSLGQKSLLISRQFN